MVVLFSHKGRIRILSCANVSSYSGQSPPALLMSLLTGFSMSFSPKEHPVEASPEGDHSLPGSPGCCHRQEWQPGAAGQAGSKVCDRPVDVHLQRHQTPECPCGCGEEQVSPGGAAGGLGWAGSTGSSPALALAPRGRGILFVGCSTRAAGHCSPSSVCSSCLTPSAPGLCSLALGTFPLLTQPLQPCPASTACPGNAGWGRANAPQLAG